MTEDANARIEEIVVQVTKEMEEELDVDDPGKPTK